MPVTMTHALWLDPETKKPRPVAAKTFNAAAMPEGGMLICRHPRCGAELVHVPLHSLVGGGEKRPNRQRNMVAYFARKAGEVHDRTVGCEYPNSVSEPDSAARIKVASRTLEFFATKTRPIIYLGSGHEIADFDLPRRYMAHFRKTSNGHGETAKYSVLDRTLSVKAAKDWRRLEKHTPFNDPFYDRVRVIANGFEMPFREFHMLSYKDLFDFAMKDARYHNRRAVLVDVRPLAHKADYNEAEGTYFVPCATESMRGQKTNFEYEIQPVLAIRGVKGDELPSFIDSARYRVWAPLQVDLDMIRALLPAIRKGIVADKVPVTLLVDSPEQIALLEKPKPLPLPERAAV